MRKVNDKKYRQLTSFLRALYEWRVDLRLKFTIDSELGQELLVLWWIRYGTESYPGTSIFQGVSKDFVLKNIYGSDFSGSDHLRLPFFDVFFNDPDLNLRALFSKESDEYISWIYAWGYRIVLRKNCPLSKIIAGRYLLWLEKYPLNVNDEVRNNFFSSVRNLFPEDELEGLLGRYNSHISVIGKHDLNIGIGYDARLIKKSIETLGIPVSTLRKNSFDSYTPINIYAMPGPDALVELTLVDQELFACSYNILSPPWELPLWPSGLNILLVKFDEIWVHSDFVFNSIPVEFRYKVKKIPLPVEVLSPGKVDRPEKFRVLAAFDFGSFMSRKNPYSAVDVFIKALGDAEDTELIIKASNSDAKPAEFNQLKEYVSPYKCIRIITEELTTAALHKLYASACCFVSLHRSEGFGRNIAEMMLLNVPVIVTGYSGNMDFTNSDNAYIVPFSLIPVGAEDYIFPSGQYWAEPDIEAAANYLKILKSNQKDIQKIKNARNTIGQRYNIRATSEKLVEYLENLLFR
jgi:hypothetical protein